MAMIDEARKWYRLHSVQLAAVAASGLAWCAANPEKVTAALDSVHVAPWLRGLVTWLVVFAIPTATRLWKQATPPCPPEAVTAPATFTGTVPQGSDGTDGA